MHKPLVAVIGAANTSDEVYALSYALGRALAERGLSVLCGGRSGVMEAVCKGVQEARGDGPSLTVALLPDSDTSLANPYLDLAIPTGLGFARNTLIANGAQAVIAVAGSSGTLSELALAWQFGKPICALKGSGGWSERLAGEALDTKRPGKIVLAETPEEAAQWALGVMGMGAT